MSQRLRIGAFALIIAVGLCPPITAGTATARAGEHTISGIVLGDGGVPLSGASVTLDGPGDSTFTVSTGVDGRWSTEVANGGYEITFSHVAGGYLTEQFDNHHERRFFSYSSGVGVHGEDVPSVDAQLVREGSVEGRILRNGAPAVDAIIQLEGVVAGEDLRFTRSGPDGRFSFPDVLPGTFNFGYTLDVGEDVPALSGGLRSVDVRSGEAVDLADLSFPDSSTHGSLELSTDGPALSDINIMSANDPVTPLLARAGGLDPGQPRTFDNLRPGAYKISLGWTSWGWLPNSWVGGLSFFSAEPFVVKAGQTTRASLSSGELMGEGAYVLNARFQSLANITVLARRVDRPDEVVASAQTRLSGQYVFDALPRADYLLTFVDPAGRYATTTIPLDPDALNIVLKRRQAPQLTPIDMFEPSAMVHVVGSRGARPVRDLQLYRADDGGGRQETSSTDVDGARVMTVRPGTYKVRLGAAHWYGGRSFSTATPFTLRSGAITSIDVGGLPTNGDLVGTARGVDGILLKDAAAMVYAADNPDELIAVAPVLGRFSVEGLPLRPYKIRIDDPTGRYASAWVGGGDSFESAPSFTPEISEETTTGTAVLPRRTGPAPWDVPPPVVKLPPPSAAPAPFRALERPRIKGSPRVGRTLRATAPTFNRRATSVKRAWYRDGSRIGGATRTTYRLKKKDAGHRITYRVTAGAAGAKSVVITSHRTRRVARQR